MDRIIATRLRPLQPNPTVRPPPRRGPKTVHDLSTLRHGGKVALKLPRNDGPYASTDRKAPPKLPTATNPNGKVLDDAFFDDALALDPGAVLLHPDPLTKPSVEPSQMVEETSARREAKRWCFTLNNPAPTDTFSDTDAIDPSIYEYLICAKEKAATGTPHLQGFICFKDKKRLSWIVKNIFVSSITRKGRGSWFICAGSVQENIDYCKKGEQSKEEWRKLKTKGPNYGLNADFVEFGTPPAQGRGEGRTNRDEVFREALSLGSTDAALTFLSQTASRDYCMQRHSLQRNLSEHFKPPPVYQPLYSLADFIHIPLQFSDKHATLVWGGSGFGKTAFVKAHFKNPLFLTHIDRLKDFKQHHHDCIIFDDMSFRHMPPETVIHLLECDNDSDIHIRYGTAHVPARVVKIFTHNTPNPFYNETINEDQQKAIDRRFKRFHVANKLYK